MKFVVSSILALVSLTANAAEYGCTHKAETTRKIVNALRSDAREQAVQSAIVAALRSDQCISSTIPSKIQSLALRLLDSRGDSESTVNYILEQALTEEF